MGRYDSILPFETLLGKTLTDVQATDYEITFTVEDSTIYRMDHAWQCCENVYVESIVGDLQDLIGTPITLAEESTSFENPANADQDSFTWTFYKLATIKGYVDIRWYGESNGYYSESVDFYEVKH